VIGKELRYFAGSNTGRGFVHYFESNFQGLDQLFILKGGPGTGKSTLMKKIGRFFADGGQDVEWIHCSSDPDSVDAVLIPGLKAGIVDGTAPHIIEPAFPGAVEEYVNMGIAWDRRKLKSRKREIIALNRDIQKTYESAFSSLAEALRELEGMDSGIPPSADGGTIDSLADDWIRRLIPGTIREEKGMVKHRFLHAITPDGVLDYFPDLTDNFLQRIFLKGGRKPAVTVLLEKIAHASSEAGYHVEIYHSGLNPLYLDMIAVRELGWAIISSSPPFAYPFNMKTDEVVEMENRSLTEKQIGEFRSHLTRCQSFLKEGIQTLDRARKLRMELEKIYVDAVHFSRVDPITEQLIREIDEK
jgi:hypothetical protein